MSQATEIKEFLLTRIPNSPHDIVAITAQHFNVTRTTVHRHLDVLIRDKKILKSGTTRNVTYILPHSLNRSFTYRIKPGLSEYDILMSDFISVLDQLPENINHIFSYAFTEIVNNAIDHSQGSSLAISTYSDGETISLTIQDDGIGIFKKLYDYFKLDDLRESILQMTKGKMTTDPENHTGEGLFFSSRALDIFEIFANGLHYFRDNRLNDWSIARTSDKSKGSKLNMTLFLNSPTTLVDIFRQFQEEEELAFDRTEIIVELARFSEEKLISRSQAKRILRNLEKFHRVLLDFTNIKLVGQGFVDEVFRVFVNQHPHIKFTYKNANEDVEFMIKRGLATAKMIR